MLVSIVIPMYNREKTIQMAVESILKQTYQDIEVIVVDDCSTDGSVEVVKNMHDERIRVITCEKNGGACVARNIGIENANGQVVAFQDSDDFWHEDKLEKSLYYLNKENADMVFSAVFRKGENQYGDERRVVPTYNLNYEKNKLARVLMMNCVSTQTIVAKKNVLEKVRFDERLPRFQDWDFALQVLKCGFDVYYIDEPLVDCWVQEDSITKDYTKAIKALEIFEKKYEAEYRQNKQAAYEFFWRMAYFLEESGNSGAAYFKKAYMVRKEKGMLFRYYLARLNLYKLFNRFYVKLTCIK
ncbi:MAG: glycosyltransferase family 2 protein [Dorea sp.]|nr:glycosyltransferase family 2 protein [Dorea sp.]MDY2814053.1 glycosyltransferase family 2 protein [Dorea sp.]